MYKCLRVQPYKISTMKLFYLLVLFSLIHCAAAQSGDYRIDYGEKSCEELQDEVASLSEAMMEMSLRMDKMAHETSELKENGRNNDKQAVST